MEFRRIKFINKRNSGNKTPRTNLQRRSACVVMLTKNPMWLEKNKKAQRIRRILSKIKRQPGTYRVFPV